MLYSFLWYFLTYSFIGWCSEVAYAAVVEKRFVNRGFLFGPVCPIYGFGIGLIYVLLKPYGDNLIILWLGSVLVTSGIELVTGILMDKIFHHKWWDYSDKPLNIGGYICVPFSLLWGFACIAVVKLVFPVNDFLIRLIPRPLGIVLLSVLGVVIVCDAVLTVLTITGLNRQLDAMDRLSGAIRTESDKLGMKVSDMAMGAAEKYGDKITDGKQKLEAKVDGYKDAALDKLDGYKDAALDKLDDYKDAALDKLDDYKGAAIEKLSDFKEKYEAAASKSNILVKRLITAFPEMTSRFHSVQLEELKNRVSVKKNKDGKRK